jgi:hypothetical protein
MRFMGVVPSCHLLPHFGGERKPAGLPGIGSLWRGIFQLLEIPISASHAWPDGAWSGLEN